MTYAGPPPGGMGGYPPPPPPPAGARLGPATIVVVFVGILLALAAVGAVYVLLNQPAPPPPQCQPGEPCAPPLPSLAAVSDASPLPTLPPIQSAPPQTSGPTAEPGEPTAPPTGEPAPTDGPAPTPVAPTPTPASDSPPVVSGQQWQDETLGYAFEYDPEIFTVVNSGESFVVLSGNFFDAQVVVRAAPASTSPADLLATQLAVVDRFLVGRVPDTDDYDALLGPSIGYIRGEGAVYSGTLVGQDGTPLAPGGVTMLASTDGRITVLVMVVVGTPDFLFGSETHQHAVRGAADLVLKTFDWDAR